MFSSKIIVGSLFLSVFLSGCMFDRFPCENEHPIFAKYAPDDQEYQRELIRQIERIGSDNLTYWVDGYRKEGNHEYIFVNMQGSGLCAVAKVTVTQWRNIEGLRRETSGYRGARLMGFNFEIQRDTSGGHLVYSNVNRIID